jgi:cephalosporin hydroxylase
MIHARIWPIEWFRAIRIARGATRRGAMQKLTEFAPLVALLMRKSPTTVLEIGAGQGGALYAFCAAANDAATLISVDLPGGAFGPRYTEEDVPRIRAYARDGQSLHLLAADSHDPGTLRRVKQILAGRPLDFLMIDGDHTYDGVRADFEMYSSLARSDGGLIALHDTTFHPEVPDCQVDRFWCEIGRGRRSLELKDPSDVREWGPWGGIGVLEP